MLSRHRRARMGNKYLSYNGLSGCNKEVAALHSDTIHRLDCRSSANYISIIGQLNQSRLEVPVVSMNTNSHACLHTYLWA